MASAAQDRRAQRYAAALPPQAVETERTVIGLIAVLALLASLPLAAASGVGGLLQIWQDQLGGRFTIIVPAESDAAEGRLDAVRRILTATPGIADIRRLRRAEVAALTRGFSAPEDFLPSVLAVSLQPEIDIDMATLRQRLKTAASGIAVDDHARWLGRAGDRLIALSLGAAAVTVLLAAAAAVAIGLITALRLQMHSGVAHLMRLLGASDQQISRQLTADAWKLAWRGAALASAAGLVLVAGVAAIRALPLMPAGLAALPCLLVPAILAGLARPTARLVAQRQLRRVA